MERIFNLLSEEFPGNTRSFYSEYRNITAA